MTPVMWHVVVVAVSALILFLVPESYFSEAAVVSHFLEWTDGLVARVRVFSERANDPYSVTAFQVFLWLMVPVLAWVNYKHMPEGEVAGWCKSAAGSLGRTVFLVALFLVFPVLYACSYGKPLLWERVLGFSSFGVFLFNGALIGVLIPVLAARGALILRMRIQIMFGCGK